METTVITGGSRGIGAAAVARFAQRGDRVVFLYEKDHEAARTGAQATGAEAICCDVADGEAVRRAFFVRGISQEPVTGRWYWNADRWHRSVRKRLIVSGKTGFLIRSLMYSLAKAVRVRFLTES